MILYIKNIIVLCLILFVCGCKNNKGKKIVIKDAPIYVEIAPSDDTLKLSTIFDKYEKVDLKNFMLGDIINVELLDSVIIIQSRAKDSDIHIFKKNGEYIRSMVQYGRANNEVINIQSMCYNKELNTIDVLCNFGMAILQCSLCSHEIKKIEIPQGEISAVNDIEIIDRQTYMLYKTFGNLKEQEYKLYVYNYVTNTVNNKYVAFDKAIEENISIGQKNNLYKVDGELYFYEVFMNGIYKYENNTIVPILAFSENRFSYPISYLEGYRSDSEFFEKSISGSYIWAHVNIQQMNNLLFSYFTYNKNIFLNLIDLNNKTSNSYKYIYDDVITNKTFNSNMLNIICTKKWGLVCCFWDSEIANDKDPHLYILKMKR